MEPVMLRREGSAQRIPDTVSCVEGAYYLLIVDAPDIINLDNSL
jgi:hypothetical protein